MHNFITIITYLLLIVLISYFGTTNKFKDVFSSVKKLPWWILGISYFIISNDNLNSMPKMGILLEKGYSGLWIYFTGIFAAGFVPIIFAPLWGKLKFLTDNQFILFRFSGISSKILHGFRAVYVGYFVVALSAAMLVIAMIKLTCIFWTFTHGQSVAIITVLLLGVIAKNSFAVKVRTDLFNGLLFVLVYIIGALYIVKYGGGFKHVYSELISNYPNQISLFARTDISGFTETIPNILVFFGIQWWSIFVLDGGGAEAQRFMSAKSSLNAFKVAILPTVILTILFVFRSFVYDAGIVLAKQTPELIPVLNGRLDFEAYFVQLFIYAVPSGIKTLVFIAFIIGFITTFEAILNWGSGFVMVDFVSTYLLKNINEKQKVRSSYFVMAFITITAICIAYFNTHMLGLQKFIFSMGAGIGPVFILRWFWWRINAWSQFTAMVSSLVYTVAFDLFYNNLSVFHIYFDTLLMQWNFDYYPLKLLILTVAVSITWLLVTFLTAPDDKQTLKNYFNTIKPGGWWPKEFGNNIHFDLRKVLLVIVYAIMAILPFFFVWFFKFYSIGIGVLLFLSWLLCFYVIVRFMTKNLK